MVRFLNCQCWLKLEQFRDSVDYVSLNIITSNSLQDNCSFCCILCTIFLTLFKPNVIIILWIGRKLTVSTTLCLLSRLCIVTALQKPFSLHRVTCKYTKRLAHSSCWTSEASDSSLVPPESLPLGYLQIIQEMEFGGLLSPGLKIIMYVCSAT